MWISSHGISRIIPSPHLGQAEVRNLEVVQLLAAEDVLRLEVSVHDAQIVQVGHTFQQRADEAGRFQLRKPFGLTKRNVV